jgi:large subunit ribosomal protein L10
MPNLITDLMTRELERSFDSSEGAVLVNYAGLTVKEDSAIRDDLAAKGVEFRMVRNNLCKRVLAERGFDLPEEVLTGNTAIAWGDAEATIGAAKVFTEKAVKKAGKVKVKAGIFEGRLLGVAETTALADIPDKDTLRAQLLSAISGPSRGLVTVLAGLPSGLARVLQANIDQGEGAEEGADS